VLSVEAGQELLARDPDILIPEVRELGW